LPREPNIVRGDDRFRSPQALTVPIAPFPAGLRGAGLCGALALLIPAAACAPRTAESRPAILDAVPAEFTATDSTAPVEIDGRWWESFGDPLLDAFIERALSGNPSIGQAIGRLRQARAAARIEESDLYPQAGATFGAEERGIDGAPSLPARFDLGVNVSWEADIWGRISSQSAAARAEYRASAADLQATRQLIAAETARTYLAVVEAQTQVELSTRVLSTYDELIRQLNLRVEAGVTPQSLAALAITDQQTARAGLEQRHEDYQRLIRRLEILVGDYPDGQDNLAAALPEVPPPPPAGVPAELLDRRPDVRSARHRIEAAGFRIDAAEASFLPSLTLTGSSGTSAASFANLFDPVTLIWSIAGRLLQPIFQGGRLRAQLEFREGERNEAIEAYAETALQALFEVETALAVDDILANQEDAFGRSAQAAEQATEISTLRYRAGIESFFNVLEAQQRALNARSAFLSARRARLFNRIDLHLAIGGGLEEEPEITLAARNRENPDQ
jgi:NodT family efflux transporter outer membrane factor (OMF) lipoprotein